MPAEPLKIILRGDDADCAIVSLAMYTDRPYADIVREIVKHDTSGGANGLTSRLIRKTMTGLGLKVRWTSKVDMDDHYGILCLVRKGGGHAVVLKAGQVIETRSTWCGVWDVDSFLEVSGYEVEGIFLARD